MNTVALRRPAPPVGFILGAWFMIAAAAGAVGLVERYPLPIPSLVMALTAALLVSLWRMPSLREWVWEKGPVPLVTLHLTRFVGVAFLVLSAHGELPATWALPTGWGDIAVAATAVPILLFAAPFRTRGQRRALFAWNVFGLVDMLWVIGGAIRLFLTDPTAGRVMESLPMSLLPTLLVPLILVSHVLLFVWLRRTNVDAPTRRLTALSRLALGGLVGIMLLFFGMIIFVFGQLQGPPVMLLTIGLFFAGLIATGWRWTPLLASLYSAFFLWSNGQRVLNELGAPSGASFYLVAAMLLLLCVTLLLGLGAGLQNYLRAPEERTLPKWLVPALSAVGGVCIGAYALAAVLPEPPSGLESGRFAELPVLRCDSVPVCSFPEELRARVGSPVAIRLENHGPFLSGMHIDELEVHALMPRGESVLFFIPDRAGTFTLYSSAAYYKKEGPKPRIRDRSGKRLEIAVVVEPAREIAAAY